MGNGSKELLLYNWWKDTWRTGCLEVVIWGEL